MSDQEINEVRRIRHKISERHGHDVNELVSHYQQLEKQLREAGIFRFADARLPIRSQETAGS